MRTIKVKAVKLDTASFEPYGKVIGEQSTKSSYSEIDLNFWEGIDELKFSNDIGQLSCLELTGPRALICEELERHIDTSMGIIPVIGESIIIFGLSRKSGDNTNSLPDLNTVKAFIFDGSKGVNIKPGVWFWIRYTIFPEINICDNFKEKFFSTNY